MKSSRALTTTSGRCGSHKTTCDALRYWPGGAAEEQEFLVHKKQELFRVLMEQTLQIEAS